MHKKNSKGKFAAARAPVYKIYSRFYSYGYIVNGRGKGRGTGTSPNRGSRMAWQPFNRSLRCSGDLAQQKFKDGSTLSRLQFTEMSIYSYNSLYTVHVELHLWKRIDAPPDLHNLASLYKPPELIIYRLRMSINRCNQFGCFFLASGKMRQNLFAEGHT